jgi:hypothetical protein
MKCIFCQQERTVFSREHVFPDAIGGALIIKDVCKDCNQRLGKSVDSPFAQLPGILHFRHQLQTARERKRDVRSPFGRESFFDVQNNMYRVERTPEGFRGIYPPQTHVDKTPDGPVIRVVLSKKFMSDPNPDVFVANEIARIEKEFGVKVSHYEISESNNAILQPTLVESNRVIIAGCLKIGYELAAVCLEGYVDDELAKKYAIALLDGNIGQSLVAWATPGKSLQEKALESLAKYTTLWGIECFCVLQNFEGIGLVAAVRVFHIFHCFVLAETDSFLDGRQLLFLNDSRTARFSCTMYKQPSTFSFILDAALLTERHLTEIQRSAVEMQDETGSVPIYSSDGEKLAPHVDALWTMSLANKDWRSLAKMNKFIFQVNGGCFVKSASSGLLFALQEVVFHY